MTLNEIPESVWWVSGGLVALSGVVGSLVAIILGRERRRQRRRKRK